jgi:hypothetical protein
MRKSELHLISDNGDTVTEIAGAVEAAHHWAVSMFTNIDTALLANAGSAWPRTWKPVRGI